MTTATNTKWREDFGIEQRKPPGLFTSKDEITSRTPQAHLLRRAFDVLQVDGILCVDHSPLAYFKLVKQVTPNEVFKLHRQFWNHSGASLLVLITDERVHIYSGMTKPTPVGNAAGDLPSLVTNLERITTVLQEFIIKVESGEFFHHHRRSFDPSQRVDRDLLDNLRDTREKLDLVTPNKKKIPTAVLDALLCRLVFTCYLFDRGVIGESYLGGLGIRGVADLRELLKMPVRKDAKNALYRLFEKLGEDFNGNLFSDDLSAEQKLIDDEHIGTLNDFFQGTNARTGQGTLFWPYDFEFIPIETISAIYERFLTEADKEKGAFYTPRFLAEVLLDTALDGVYPLIGKRFLDPACGSGIFLVGLFNRIAEEWRQANPSARNDRKSKELMQLLQGSLFGVDTNKAACRITAFSLYLAYLDQLSPPDIQALQKKGRALPDLVAAETQDGAPSTEGTIRRADFFAPDVSFPKDVSLVIGNPPWGSIATDGTAAATWCEANSRPLPDKQIAAAFVWKSATHVTSEGRVCLLLPHGLLFNHSTTAIPFQKEWIKAHAIERVINLADLRFLLFEKAIHPALIVSFMKHKPASGTHSIEYWTPKGDWTVTQAEVITIAPQDRTQITTSELLRDLDSADAPQIWKRRYWATPRDWRLLERLSDYPRLRDHVRQTREKKTKKRWLIAQGFQPLGPGDKKEDSKAIDLPAKAYIGAKSESFDMFLLPDDCESLPSKTVRVRGRSGVGTDIFLAPHVLVTRGYSSTGFSSCAYADFDVAFRSSVRGIHGPKADRDLLVFLAAFLRSSLVQYILIHQASSLGIYRPEVHDKDLLQLPFPLPDQMHNPTRSWEIVREVARLVTNAISQTSANFLQRHNQIQTADTAIQPLINEYFDLIPLEQILIEDTIKVTVPSIQPTLSRMPVATVVPASTVQCDAYCDRVCSMLNGWSRRGGFTVEGKVLRSESLGIAIAVLEKVKRSRSAVIPDKVSADLLRLLDTIRKAIPQKHATLDIVRGVTVFDGNRLYLAKPIGQRFWTQTAAMNDADEIASTILMRSPKENA